MPTNTHLTDSHLHALANARSLARSGLGRSIRIGAGLSLREIASALDVDASTVFRWERGDRSPRGEPGIRWAALLRNLAESQL